MTRSAASILVVAILLPGCGWPGKNTPPAPTITEKRLAGRVYKVNQDAGFVVIRRYGMWRVADNEIVESRGQGRSANLQPTGERLGEHVAADIRSGQVGEGDVVYIRRIQKAEMPEILAESAP